MGKTPKGNRLLIVKDDFELRLGRFFEKPNLEGYVKVNTQKGYLNGSK